MCPACISTAAAIAAGAISSGGLAALAMMTLRPQIRPELYRFKHSVTRRRSWTPRIVTRDEWVAARKDLLVKEKALTRAHDALSAERRRLPMVKIEKNYVFETPSGKRTLAELFDGKSQLIVYHFMMGPDWTEGCPSCSLLADTSTAASSTSRTATSR